MELKPAIVTRRRESRRDATRARPTIRARVPIAANGESQRSQPQRERERQSERERERERGRERGRERERERERESNSPAKRMPFLPSITRQNFSASTSSSLQLEASHAQYGMISCSSPSCSDAHLSLHLRRSIPWGRGRQTEKGCDVNLRTIRRLLCCVPGTPAAAWCITRVRPLRQTWLWFWFWPFCAGRKTPAARSEEVRNREVVFSRGACHKAAKHENLAGSFQEGSQKLMQQATQLRASSS